MNTTRPFLALLAVIALLLGACAPAPTPALAPVATQLDQAAQTKAAVALAGSEWQLESLFGGAAAIPVVPGTQPTLGFLADRYIGFSGCNYFMGAYTARENNAVSINKPALTDGGCVNEAKASNQQGTYMSALASTVRYEQRDGKLVLYTSGDQPVLTFTTLAGVPLKGTAWDLSFSYDSKVATWRPTLPGMTLVFDDKQVSGNAGCNDYNATYTLENGLLKIGAIALTKKTCSTPEGIMEQEQAYVAMLQSARGLQKYPRSILLAGDNVPLLMYHAGR